jgi:hypothetical protein
MNFSLSLTNKSNDDRKEHLQTCKGSSYKCY